MAYTSRAFIASFFFVFLITLSLQKVSGRNVPTDPNVQAEFAGYDGTVRIPGLGRFFVPKEGQRPGQYNPITGAPGGSGFPTVSGGGSGNLYGRDDNPFAQVPSPFTAGVPHN